MCNKSIFILHVLAYSQLPAAASLYRRGEPPLSLLIQPSLPGSLWAWNKVEQGSVYMHRNSIKNKISDKNRAKLYLADDGLWDDDAMVDGLVQGR